MPSKLKKPSGRNNSACFQTAQAINQIIYQLHQKEIQIIGQDLLEALKLTIAEWPPACHGVNTIVQNDAQLPTTDPYLSTAEILIRIHSLANKSNLDDLTHKVQPQILKCLGLYQQPFERENEADLGFQ